MTFDGLTTPSQAGRAASPRYCETAIKSEVGPWHNDFRGFAPSLDSRLAGLASALSAATNALGETRSRPSYEGVADPASATYFTDICEL